MWRVVWCGRKNHTNNPKTGLTFNHQLLPSPWLSRSLTVLLQSVLTSLGHGATLNWICVIRIFFIGVGIRNRSQGIETILSLLPLELFLELFIGGALGGFSLQRIHHVVRNVVHYLLYSSGNSRWDNYTGVIFTRRLLNLQLPSSSFGHRKWWCGWNKVRRDSVQGD